MQINDWISVKEVIQSIMACEDQSDLKWNQITELIIKLFLQL